MTTELTPIDIAAMPELAHLADEVRRTRRPRLLQRAGEDVAMLVPPRPRTRRRAAAVTEEDALFRPPLASCLLPLAAPLTEEDALFRLVGIGRSGIPGGVSGKKHAQLRQALDHR